MYSEILKIVIDLEKEFDIEFWCRQIDKYSTQEFHSKHSEFSNLLRIRANSMNISMIRNEILNYKEKKL